MLNRLCVECGNEFTVKWESIPKKTCTRQCWHSLRGKSISETNAKKPKFNQKEYNKRYYNEHKEDIKKATKEYAQSNKVAVSKRRQKWELSNQEHRKEVFSKWYLANKQNCIDRAKKWKHEHPEAVRANTRSYASRRRGALGKFSSKDFIKLKNNLLGKCGYCGDNEADTIDHILPLSRGGTNWVGNIMPACGSCNYSKQCKTVAEWRHGKTVCSRSVGAH